MSKLNIERLRQTKIPEEVLYTQRSLGLESQLARFLRWAAWTYELGINEFSEEVLKLGVSSMQKNAPVGKLTAGFLLRLCYGIQDAFMSCPLNFRQIEELGRLSVKKPDRWTTLVAQIREHVLKEAKS